MSVETRLHHDARCPRCGYDLRGALETWNHECPISGVCTECGLEFEWGELLCSRRAVPRWCVEYARGWLGIAFASIKTVLVMLWPSKFWRDLKMVHEPRWRRFSALALLVLFLLYLAFALSVGFDSYTQMARLKDSIISNQAYNISTPFHPVLHGLYATINPFSNNQFTYTVSSGPNTLTGTLSSPRSIAERLRPSHFWREVYIQIRSNQFAPFREQLRMPVIIVHGIMLIALCPLVIMVLPLSLRKAKVRWQHLVRIALYSSLIIVPPMGLHIHNEIYWFKYWSFEDWLIPSSLIFVLLGMIIWWSLASKHYLKLPHAWWVGVSIVVLAYAGGLFFVSFIDFLMM